MSELEKEGRETETSESSEADRSPDMIRRDFLKRFGAYSAGTCAGLFVLMSPSTSKALGSTGDDGGG